MQSDSPSHLDESLFRELFDLMPQLGWSAQADGFIDYYNRAWYEYTGSTPAEMEGWGWESVHDPADLARVKEGWIDSIKSGKPFEMTFRLRRKDGQFRWFMTRATPVYDEARTIIR